MAHGYFLPTEGLPSQITLLEDKKYDLWEGKGFGSPQEKGDENEVDEDIWLIQTLKDITDKS